MSTDTPAVDDPRLPVRPGGPWTELADGPLLLRKRSVSDLDNDVYLLGCIATRRALLVDPADDPERIRDLLADWTPVAAVVTHGHWDHVRAWDALADDDGLAVWCHPEDRPLLPRAADRWLTDGDVLDVGDLRVEVIHLPGHTPGSIVLAVRGRDRWHLMTGDTLFPGGPGNTGGDAERHRTIMDGLEARVFARFDDDTWVHPGHGDGTTLGRERPSLPDWRARGW